MKKLFIILLLMTSLTAHTKELLEVPDSLQGVWHTIAFSQDKGVTSTDGRGQAFLRMYGTQAAMNNGITQHIGKVDLIKDNDVLYLVLHPNGLDSYWIISDKGNDQILVQIWNVEQDKETARFLFYISK